MKKLTDNFHRLISDTSTEILCYTCFEEPNNLFWTNRWEWGCILSPLSNDKKTYSKTENQQNKNWLLLTTVYSTETYMPNVLFVLFIQAITKLFVSYYSSNPKQYSYFQTHRRYLGFFTQIFLRNISWSTLKVYIYKHGTQKELQRQHKERNSTFYISNNLICSLFIHWSNKIVWV